MMKLKTKKNEYDHFVKLSNEWWDENGKFAVLHKIRPLRMSYILNQIKEKNIKNLEILDVGCGGGLICEPLSRLGAKVTGIDYVPDNIKIANTHSKKKRLKINYICDDIENIKFNKKFDLIIIFEVLEHLDNWEYFILKIKKNLKFNGKILISTINRNIFSKYLTIFFAENILNWIPRGTHQYEKFIRPEEIRSFSKKNNLEFGNLEGLIYNPISSSWNLSKNSKINYFCSLKRVN